MLLTVLATMASGGQTLAAQAPHPHAASASDAPDGLSTSSATPYNGGVSYGPATAGVDSERLLVRFRANSSSSQRSALRGSLGARVVHSYRLVPGLELLDVSSATRAAKATAFRRNTEVSYAIPDVVYRAQSITPNDPLLAQQWGLESIAAPEAWGRTSGSHEVIVAVLDSGVELEHPDLEANIWSNPNPGADGYTGDLHGWNFISNNSDPGDDFGHGTHVAGIIGAAGDNGIGVSGVNWSVSLMALKICNSEGLCSLSAEIEALEYAVQHGAKVANASFGAAYGGYQPEREAIEAAGRDGLLYVAAAGNNTTSNDVIPFYPASYPLENMLSVAATDSTGELAYFSDYGQRSVELAAPGQEILSTLPGTGTTYSSASGYGYLSGTSMAAPQVAGAAALLWSLHPTWTTQQIRARLLDTVRPLPALFGKVSSCGALDVGAATAPVEVQETPLLCAAIQGSGSGSISSQPPGIHCGSECSIRIPRGSEATLTATPAAGSTFAGWRGACSATGPCTVTDSGGSSVTADFQSSGTPEGWQEQPLSAPAEREPMKSESSADLSFYGVSLSADGNVRAETIYNPPANCLYSSSDTGGIYLEEKTQSGWLADGTLHAPSLGSDSGAQWTNCSDFGSLSELSGEGQTLLVSAEQASVYTAQLGERFRCAALVYQHGQGGWALQGTLYPPGVGATGSASAEGCGYFGIGGSISDDGSRVAVLGEGRVDVFQREGSQAEGFTWTLSQQIVLAQGAHCTDEVGAREIAMSGQGTQLLVSQPSCQTAGFEGSGRLYAYTLQGSQFSLTQTIESPEAELQNGFGGSLAISDDGQFATVSVGPRVSGLPFEADAAWILANEGASWHLLKRLIAPTPTDAGNFSCPTIIEDGARVVCHAADQIGYDPHQGAIYIFSEPAGGWGSEGHTPTRLFATDGAAGDELGAAGAEQWPVFAAAADGSAIDATISPRSLITGAYANDRIGYEFTYRPPAQPTIAGFSPSSGGQESQIAITGTNLIGTSSVRFGGVPATVYTVESQARITATVPAGASSGPITLTTPSGNAESSEGFDVLTSLRANASEAVFAGGEIYDTATLSGGSSPSGTITFTLYEGSDSSCSKPLEVLHRQINGDGTYSSPAIVWQQPGSYQWVADYSGDEHNPPAGTSCAQTAQEATVTPLPSPAVTSESASSVSATSVVLEGAIDARMNSTSYYFEYGQSETLGQRTASEEVQASPDDVALEGQTITDLEPDTTYYFRLRAANATSEALGPTRTFKTLALSSPITAPLTPVQFTPPPSAPAPSSAPATTAATAAADALRPTPAFSDLWLPAIQHRASVRARLLIERAGSRLEIQALAATRVIVASKRGRGGPVVLAQLTRGSLPTGPLELVLVLKGTASRLLARQGHLDLRVTLAVIPPSGEPQHLTRRVTLVAAAR